MALVLIDPIVLRWMIAALVLGLLAVLASGWRYQGTPSLPVTAGVGIFAGLGSGAVQIAGPAVIIFWLGGASDAVTVRANLMVFFLLMGVHHRHRLSGAGHPDTRRARAVDPARRAVHSGDVGRRALVPRRFGAGLPPRRLPDHRRVGDRQHAAVGCVAAVSYALIFCTSASDTSKLA